jgi:hypothetical protein
MSSSLFEDLELKDERSLLIQGLPSSIEKVFIKLSYAKNVTPLLKSRKIDFALIFAVNQNQLNNILREVFSALHSNSKLWIAYPKTTSKIVSDLNRQCSWDLLIHSGFENVNLVSIDNVWNAIRFKKTEIAALPLPIKNGTTITAIAEHKDVTSVTSVVEFEKTLVVPPVELEKIFKKHKGAKEFFTSLSVTHQNEYVSYIEDSKKGETKQRRLESVVEKLTSGKRTPLEN